MARRKSDSGGENEPQPTFEDALEGLESIIEAMENEQLPLEDLVSHYEKGAALLERCESILGAARKRIELITLRHRAGPDESPDGGDDAETNLQPPPSDNEDDPDDDIRLF